MYPNQPQQQPPTYPPQPPQNSGPAPYPEQQTAQQPTQWNQPYQQQTQPNGPQPQQPLQQPQQQWNQPSPTAYEPQPSLVPDGIASIDYLNQISTHKNRGTGFSKKQLFLLGGLLMLAVGALMAFMLSNKSAPNINALSQQIVLRTKSLSEVAKESQKNIKNQSLSTANSGLTIQLSSSSTSLAKTFTDLGVKTEKASPEITAAESNEELLKKLEDARLSGTFDRVYSREMSYNLQMTLSLINDIHARTNNADLKKQLEESYKNIEPLQKQIAEFTGTTS
jgi:predicted outer membrane protein